MPARNHARSRLGNKSVDGTGSQSILCRDPSPSGSTAPWLLSGLSAPHSAHMPEDRMSDQSEPQLPSVHDYFSVQRVVLDRRTSLASGELGSGVIYVPPRRRLMQQVSDAMAGEYPNPKNTILPQSGPRNR